jgi:hypothetical protein
VVGGIISDRPRTQQTRHIPSGVKRTLENLGMLDPDCTTLSFPYSNNLWTGTTSAFPCSGGWVTLTW